MKQIITSIILMMTSASGAQTNNTDQTLIALRLQTAEMRRLEAMQRLMAITHIYSDDKEMTEVFDIVGGAMLSSASIATLAAFFGQNAYGAIKGKMGNEFTHLRRVGLSSLGFGAAVAGISGAVAHQGTINSAAYNDEVDRLTKMSREQALDEYKQLINVLNNSSAEIEKIKNPRP